MDGVKLISAGNDIKLWDTDFNLYKQVNPHDDNISSIAWNHDNNFLASTSVNTDKIVITCVIDPSLSVLEIPIENKAKGLSLDFSSKSRYILVGRSDNAISLYDCKTYKYKKTYKDHKGPVTCVQFNWNDTYIASGSETGEIILYNAATGQRFSPLVAPGVQAIRQIQYSFCKKSLLASASDDGSINLWDTNTRRLLHSFNKEHRAPASGLAFSPINDSLLCSIGLDKRIQFYDVESRRVLQHYFAESPLTSIDMMHDGTTLAVGSNRGKVFVYDVRLGRSPIKTFNAHRSSVQALKFRNNQEIKTRSKENSMQPQSEKLTRLSPSQKRHLPVAPSTDPVSVTKTPESYNTVSRIPDNMAGETFEDILSPLREGYDESKERSASQSRSFNSTDSLFSPLAENSNMLKVARALGSMETSMVTSPLAGKTHVSISTERGSSFTMPQQQISFTEASPPQGKAMATLEASPLISPPIPRSSQGPVLNSSSDSATYSRAHISPRGMFSASSSLPSFERAQQDGGEAATGLTNGNPIPRTINFNENLPVVPSAGASTGSPEGAVASSHSDRRYRDFNTQGRQSDRGDNLDNVLQKSPQIQPFQEQLIRSMIAEELEELRDQTHRDMLSMHAEIIRQFQIQLGEVRAMFQHYSLNEALVAEVERLKEENKRLKKTF